VGIVNDRTVYLRDMIDYNRTRLNVLFIDCKAKNDANLLSLRNLETRQFVLNQWCCMDCIGPGVIGDKNGRW